MNVSTEVLDVLSNAVINENTLKLVGQLDRKLYVSTNKVLEAAGGKWNRKASAHLFDGDASEIIEQVILTGKITDKKSELGYFPTPKTIVARLLELAQVEPGMTVLEPEAGQGAIAEEVAKIVGITNVDTIEVDDHNCAILREKGFEFALRGTDFLTANVMAIYDRVVMNPPFAKRQDIAHVRHAFQFLKPGGRLVSVMSAGVEFRSDRIGTEFRQFVEDHDGSIEKLPEGSFLESGTGVNTVIVTINA